MLQNQTIKITLPSAPSLSYPIIIGNNLAIKLVQYLPKTSVIVIISDTNVANLYLNLLNNVLIQEGFCVHSLVIPPGESSKTRKTKEELEDKLLELACDRSTYCIALGGGVVGDLTGFVASSFMRGINFIQVPSSLLAMLDSSIGGKTGVNTALGKNLIGAFWQPKAVFMDTYFLNSLPECELINGFFEAIKIFLSLDYKNFYYCVNNLNKILAKDNECLEHVVYHAVKLKVMVITRDAQEKNFRMILNFGHTIGHALEKLSNYTIMHGYAVGMGIIIESRIANYLGLLEKAKYDEIYQFLIKLKLNLSLIKQFQTVDIVKTMRNDKKNTNGKIKLVLLTSLGAVKNIDQQVAFAVNEEDIIKVLEEFGN